uniref:Cilia- and flagella-associated protein 97 n=1 Tax=Geotrypetes seraphini TaxID=260995 RepID=A0A6P8PB07_GEOSA|nr:cilia- and flagella-associated protein 97-like [Geotrypetes seraphini]
MDLNQLLKAFMRLDKKDQRNLVTETPATKIKKNYSFTNNEVRQIDRENQRLLKELSKQNSGMRSNSIIPKKLTCPPVRLYHSAVNRLKEQQRIEKDNLALLKRLEAVKPTTGITRTEQLMDYHRQSSYLCTTVLSPRPGKSTLSRLSLTSDIHKRASSASMRRIERPCSNSSSTTTLTSKKSTNVRAAWM